jgi:hypothetical protein
VLDGYVWVTKALHVPLKAELPFVEAQYNLSWFRVMASMRKRVSCMIVLLLACSLRASAQTEDSAHRNSKASIAASDAQHKTIRRELARLSNHDWAGEYYYGDGLGVNVSLALAPESGFVFRWDGCLGLYDLNYGGVVFTNGVVKLLFRYPNDRKGLQVIAPELLPVRWGERHYLIPADSVVKFTNAINAGTEPSPWGHSGEFLLERGDEKKKIDGQPNLPDKYLSYILTEPIKTRISSVDETHVQKSRRITSITLDAGSANGLRQGMELYVQRPSNLYGSALVTSVSGHSAQAVIEQTELTDPVPATGWRLSTKL